MFFWCVLSALVGSVFLSPASKVDSYQLMESVAFGRFACLLASLAASSAHFSSAGSLDYLPRFGWIHPVNDD